jgi:hypothetical protein
VSKHTPVTASASWAAAGRLPIAAKEEGRGAAPQSIAGRLTVPERVLLFCLASETDWQAASVTHATAQHLMVRGLIERAEGATRYRLTELGMAVLEALLDPSKDWTRNCAASSGRLIRDPGGRISALIQFGKPRRHAVPLPRQEGGSGRGRSCRTGSDGPSLGGRCPPWVLS